jgi:hypothetical protein
MKYQKSKSKMTYKNAKSSFLKTQRPQPFTPKY